MKQRGHFIVDTDICLYTHTVWKNMHPTSNYRIRDEAILYAAFNFGFFSPQKHDFLKLASMGKSPRPKALLY